MATQDDDPVVPNPTWLGNIRYFFNSDDIGCMKPRGIDLSSYTDVKSHAFNIYLQTQNGNMPLGGPPWSANRVQTFLNWINTKYPMGAPAPQALAAADAAAPGARVRKNINALSQAELDTLIQAFRGIMSLDPTDTNSYYYVASVHGVPLLYCMHHVPPFTAWHRIYMKMFEDALRSVPGCENVTLPYWDVTTLAPDIFWSEPLFASYTVPVALPSPYGANYTTQRYDAQTIYNNYQQPTAVPWSISQALTQAKFGTWQQVGTFDYYLVQAHDNGHDRGGLTLQDPNVAAFDPIFWFFHCNWDRIWWNWQVAADATTLDGFSSTLDGNTGWLQFPLAPWSSTTADTITNEGIVYDQPSQESAEMLTSKSASVGAHRTFTLSSARRVSVRVKDINRLAIPGTFTVRLLADGEEVARQAFFQPPVPKDCPTCGALPLVSINFEVDQEALAGKQVSIAIHVPSLGEGEMAAFPLSQAGNPTINARLLLEES